MDLTGPLVMPADVVLVPVTELPEETRARFEWEEGDYALTRPGTRARSRIVGADMAHLLREFRAPVTIAAALIRYCGARGLAPEPTLEQVFPMLGRFVESRVLVPPEDAGRIGPSYAPGEVVAGFEVLECAQALEDTEVYRARARDGSPAAVKITRPGCRDAALDREARVLARLGGGIAPRLLAEGTHDGRRYLALEWCAGVPVTTAAGECRRDAPGLRERLLRLCREIARCYAVLHERGVIHGDVHPRNLLADRDGRVRLIDFGLAALDGDAPGERGGVAHYLEPEYAAARLRGRHAPAATPEGEQYAVAALLYHLLTGVHYREFSAEKHEMWRQIAEDPPLPFAPRARPWPEAEAVLSRALAKAPGDRFPSSREFAVRLDAVRPPLEPAGHAVPPAYRRAASALVDDVIRELSPDAPPYAEGLPAAPRASVYFGAAGIAYALYRLSCLREEPGLLSAADLWAERARRGLADADAFRDDGQGITPDVVGAVTPYHTASGVHAVRALIGHAMGDVVSVREALGDFTRASRHPCANPDLTLGRSSILIGATVLLNALSRLPAADLGGLRALGDETMAGIWAELDPLPPVRVQREIRYLGLAHGWAGLLHATLAWCRTAGRTPPPGVERRLAELAECAEPTGRGLRWRIMSDPAARMRTEHTSGWCNGSAGHLFLWIGAHRLTGDETHLTLAERAAWNVWEEPYLADNLCCGLAGAAYALAALHRATGDAQWAVNARELGNRAIEETRRSGYPHSLYKGPPGVAVLAADLLDPARAAMPLFEPEYA
ncbi:lanthionine synthetase LanC family protein [Bailinhaonella thermotolerans]|uniref:Protein kinase domain-containing protein n=1 Tax=Bailinhaonella thermotolerans TaxID=1070861 RepID=A0A3A4BQJ9_9ACTN|nr:lanthionine synthetase LanC family protein [Bailinhaonella thermotolerans]RJL33416.1 hypothetical protein D5H75_11545 [Bailinhaonella thermotolerans]